MSLAIGWQLKIGGLENRHFVRSGANVPTTVCATVVLRFASQEGAVILEREV